jgi:hypothetical protein
MGCLHSSPKREKSIAERELEEIRRREEAESPPMAVGLFSTEGWGRFLLYGQKAPVISQAYKDYQAEKIEQNKAQAGTEKTREEFKASLLKHGFSEEDADRMTAEEYDRI